MKYPDQVQSVPNRTASTDPQYRGRIAPSPTGYLHLGHARTFWTAQERARAAGGILILRNEDLDRERCRPGFAAAMIEDLRWFGFEWQEGPDLGGPFGPYIQSERLDLYEAAFQRLREGGFVYPCICSRRDVQRALRAPHQGDDEPVYPGTCRPRADPVGGTKASALSTGNQAGGIVTSGGKVNWRFRVPDGEAITFVDGALGPQTFRAGDDFGDFVVWRHDGIPSYQLAVTVDDAAMQITEVVRGSDLLVSTARQLLLYGALSCVAPKFHHCALVTDAQGIRLAKRHDALSLRALREQGLTPVELRELPAFRNG
jgi:glutamyl/glutaminyl-tRNA synthetase